MKQVSLQNKKVLCCLSVVLILGILMLGACINPAPINGFLQDAHVSEIINEAAGGDDEPGVKPGIGVEPEPPAQPLLAKYGDSYNQYVGTADNPITLTGASVTIEITNYDDVTDMQPSTIQWYCENYTLTGGGRTYTVSNTTAPFTTPWIYQLYVVWEVGTGANAKTYQGDIFIRVP